MIENLPHWIDTLFLATCFLAIGLFHYSNGKPKKLTLLIILWWVLQSVLAYTGFYQVSDSIPPRFALVLLPTTLLIVYGLLPKQREWLLTKRSSQVSTFLHAVRLPVEIVLFGLFTHKMIPELMTFEGRNFDINRYDKTVYTAQVDYVSGRGCGQQPEGAGAVLSNKGQVALQF